MMSLEVLRMPHSPYCIAVESCLDSLGVDYHVRTIPSWDRREILQRTDGAYYEVPVLLHEGEAVWESGGDSQDVARYVDREFGGGRLFPADLSGLQDLVIRYLENEVESVSFRIYDPDSVEAIENLAERGMTIRHKERKFGRGCVDDWRVNRKELLESVESLLLPLEEMLSRASFLFGEQPVYADFLLAGILGNLTFAGKNRLPEGLPHLELFQQKIASFRYA